MGDAGPPAPRPAGRGRARELLTTALAALAVAALLRGSVLEVFHVAGGSMVPTLRPGDLVLVSRLAYGVRLPFTRLTVLELPAPRRGDVVVFRDPRHPEQRLVKRVVGVAGDVVELREQRLLVNGVAQPRAELGELTYLEAGEGAAPSRLDACRRWREALATGPVAPPPVEEPEAMAAAWGRAAAAGVSTHEVLQCRRIRPGRREGPFGPVRPGHLFVLGDNRDRSDDGRADGGWQVPLAEVEGRVALVGWGWGPAEAAPGAGSGLRMDRLFKPVE